VAKKKSRPTRSRTAQREAKRGEEKLYLLREKLAMLEPGGDEERPITVSSASVIEPRAESLPCLRCEQQMRVESHESRNSPRGGHVRVLELACKACGAERTVFFRVEQAVLN
jgi:hypothetical protein